MLHINIFGPMIEHAGFQNGLGFQCVSLFRETIDSLLKTIKNHK